MSKPPKLNYNTPPPTILLTVKEKVVKKTRETVAQLKKMIENLKM